MHMDDLKTVLLTVLTGRCSCDRKRGHNIDNDGVFLSVRKEKKFSTQEHSLMFFVTKSIDQSILLDEIP